MLTYEIRHDGWPVGIGKGKKKSVDLLKKRLEWEGVTKQEWINKGGTIYCYTDQGVFSIEQSNS